MTIGMCIDFVLAYVDFKQPNQERSSQTTIRKATQDDYDFF